MAANGILSNVSRSALTVLGVAIGVASVVGLMGIGEGARLNVMEQFESLGTNVIAIKAHDENYEFQPDKAGELVQRVESLEMATPVVSTDTTMRWRRTTGLVVANPQLHLPVKHIWHMWQPRATKAAEAI